MKEKIIASIQARISSSRLPGKVLLPFCGIPALAHMVRRLRKSSFIQEIVIATTTNLKDNAVCGCASKEGSSYFRGSEHDVLDRVVKCHQEIGSDIIVQLTGDCPMIDVYWVDRTIEKFLSGEYDFVSNCIPMTFPRGLDCKVFRLSDLEWIAENINDPAVCEHVSLYFYEEEGRYRLGSVEAPSWVRFPWYRWALDTEQDSKLIKKVFEALYSKKNNFCSWDIMHFIRENPDIPMINKSIKQKPIR